MLKAAPSLQSSSLAGRPQLLCNVWPLRAARSAAAVAGRQFSQRAQQRLSSRGLIVAQANNVSIAPHAEDAWGLHPA